MPLIPQRPEFNKFREVEGETFIHVSDLLYKCGRKIALSKRFEIPVTENPIFASQGITFAIGNAIHDYIVDKVATAHHDVIFGRWACCCGHKHHVGLLSEARSHDNCPRCRKPMENYNEQSVINRDLNIIGSPDLQVLHDNAYTVGEIKSIAANRFEELSRPIPEHIIQVLFYWYLLREENRRSLHDHVSILYVNKEYRMTKPYKEFTINAPDSIHRLEPYIEMAQAIKEGIEGGELPARTQCATKSDKEAKKCEVCSLCFDI